MRTTMVPIFALGVLLAGCGSAGDAPAGTVSSAAPPAKVGKALGPMPASTATREDLDRAATLESCRLVSKDELARALGQPYRDPEPGVDSDSAFNQVLPDVQGSCVFWATERRAGGVGEIDVLVVRPADPASAYAKLRDNYRDVPSAKDVDGFGDSAFQSGQVMFVRKGKALLETSVNWTEGDDVADARLRTVTQLALARP